VLAERRAQPGSGRIPTQHVSKPPPKPAAAPCFVALDQSTSATKALLFDASGALVDGRSREHRQHYPRPGWVEHDGDEIWENSLAVLRELIAGNPAAAARIAWLSVTNQRETVIVFDRSTGRPLCPAIVWQCRRGEGICAEHEAAGRGGLVAGRTGLRLDPYFSGSKIQWIARERPDIRRRLESGEAVVGTIDAYLVHRLTGGAVFATDATNASRTLLFDAVNLRWDPELCALWEVPVGALPEVRESASRFGETTLGGALARPVPICGVMGDSQASLYAHGCYGPGSAKVTFGTGSSILANIGPRFRQSGCGLVTALAWVFRGVPTYAFEGIIISSAATLIWLRDQLGLFGDFSEVEAIAASVPDSGGVYLVPAFSGLGLPHWRPSARAAIVGLSAHSDRRHVVRAAVDSIALQVRDALAAMQSDMGEEISSLHGDGGSSMNRQLMQLAADLTGLDLHVATIPECSALGAGLMGMAGMGLRDPLERPACTLDGETVYRPSPETGGTARLLAGWTQAVRQVLLACESPLDNPAK
jgi:glycerol kinase